jgi:hypothetical protein
MSQVKTEDKKQQNLPQKTSVTSHDIVLGRIKRIGGQSYGGSLDTILRHQPKGQVQTQSSLQQPNIPRIKAIDRMLGVQSLDSTEYTEIPISENKSGSSINEEQFPSDSTCSVSKYEVVPSGREEIKCGEVSLHRAVATSSDIQEMKQTNFKLGGDESNKQTKAAVLARSENQNHQKFNVISTKKAKKCTTDFLKNERYICSLVNEEEIIVENKLYEKTKEVENEGEDELYDETNAIQQKVDCCEVENKLYEKNKLDKEDKEYDSVEELSSFPQVHEILEDEKMYEVVSASVDVVKQVQEDVQILEDGEEDYYCSYDKFSLMRLLSDQRNSPSPEPDLPPRPSVGSYDSPKSHLAHECSKTDDEEAEYSLFYESTESYNTNTSPSHLLLSSADGSEKKGSKLRVRIKLRRKKSPSKESVSSEDGNNNNKTKRKMSFLRRMLKHYYKKPEHNSEAVVISDNRRMSDEPEYESVDYLASILKQGVTEEELPDHASRSKSTESHDKAVLKEKLFGTKNLLTEQAMTELKMKLKGRDNATGNEPAVSAKEVRFVYSLLLFVLGGGFVLIRKQLLPSPRNDASLGFS